MTPTPGTVDDWIAVLKNLVLIIVGVFIILHETLGTEPPSVLLLITAAAALSLPIVGALQSLRVGK